MPAASFRSLGSHPGRTVALVLAVLVVTGTVVAALGDFRSSGGDAREVSSIPQAGLDKAVPTSGGPVFSWWCSARWCRWRPSSGSRPCW